MRHLGGLFTAVLVAALASCSGPRPATPGRDPAPTPSATASASAPAPSAAPAAKPGPTIKTDADDPDLRAMLARVAGARALPIKGRVKFAIVDRDALLARARHKLETEMPPGVVALQGEILRALGVVPLDFDLAEGLLRLLQGRVAGFYDPDDQTMYLLDDLPPGQEEETLAHELVHALQDQSFSLGPLLDYRPGRSDELTAQQLLVEGDATSAMFDVSVGSAFAIDEDQLDRAFRLSTAVSTVGMETPAIVRSSLVAPYTVGFRFVQELRRTGDWRAVDAAFRELPTTTEQVLHPEKYFVRERAVELPTPSIAALGEGFEAALVEQNGELGMRLLLEEWAARPVAARAAAGWGGDRLVIARRRGAGGEDEFALGLWTRMDTEPEAVELAAVLTEVIGKACRLRPELGPLHFERWKRDVVLVAGPYARQGAVARPAGDCALATRWARDIVGQARAR